MELGSWLLFDRDMVDDMPADARRAELRRVARGGRPPVPRLRHGRLRRGALDHDAGSRSTACRSPQARATSSSRIDDPSDLKRAWSQAASRALITEFRGEPLGFAKPKRSRATGEIVAHDWGTIFDKSVAALARLVFDGAPVVRGDGLAVLPPRSRCTTARPRACQGRDLTPRKEKALARGRPRADPRHAPDVNLTQEHGPDGSPASRSSIADLTMDLELETERGRTTVGALHAAGAGHTRCQSPFRESTQLGRVLQRPPRRHAVRLRQRHRREARARSATGRATMSTIIRDWLTEELQPRFRYAGRQRVLGHAGGAGSTLREIVGAPDELIDRLAMASDAPCDAKVG